MTRSPDSLPPPPVSEPAPAASADDGIDPTAVRDPLLGMELGEYRITRRLGEGGMGVVYAGLQPVIQKPVAIKILQLQQADAPGQAGEADRLVAEARAANAVRHRGIVDVFAFGKMPDGRPYIVMDLLEGEPLDAIIEREAPLTIDRVLSVLDDVLDTLSAAHAAGVIHRDLKPANMFLVRQAHGGAYVRILDFGLAKRSVGGARTSRASMVAGTPHYMAPEQALGEAVGPRADLYSVGCIAYEMLTGRLPFDTEDPVEQIAKRLSSVPERAAKVARVPAELDEIVMRLLEREPANRPASAAVVRQQLSKYRRNLQNESTVMAPRPASQAPQPRPQPEPQPEDPTLKGPAPYPPTPSVPDAQRITQKTPRSRSLALAVAAAGVVALLGVAAAVVLVPRGSDVDEAAQVPDPPVAVDEPAAEPEKLAEPKPPPEPDPEPKLAPQPAAAEPKPGSDDPKTARTAPPKVRPDSPRPAPAGGGLEARRKEVAKLLAEARALPNLPTSSKAIFMLHEADLADAATVQDLEAIRDEIKKFIRENKK